jgi:hypothetical protein
VNDRSSEVQAATARPIESSGSLDGIVAAARDETAPLVAAAVPINSGALNGTAALSGPNGNVIALGSLGGSTVSQDGRAVFDGALGSPVSDLAVTIPGRQAAEASPSEHVPFGLARTSVPNSGEDESFEELPSSRHDRLSPQRSDLLTDLRLFDRTSLEHAIDEFLQQSESLEARLSWMSAPAYLLTEIVGVAFAVTGAKVVIKMLGRSAHEDAASTRTDDDDSFDRFSGFLGP